MIDMRPIRVLHIFGKMDRGGAETWVMNVFRNIDRNRYQFDFLVTSEEPGAYDDEIRSLGGRIVPVGAPQRLLRYTRDFRTQVLQYGPYDVMHSHVHHFSGVTLSLARSLGIPIRIAHSHSDTSREQRNASIVRKLYLHVMESLVQWSSTVKLAGSAESAASLFGPEWAKDGATRIIYTAIDLEPFKASVDRTHLKRELGILQDTFVVGHVGRFAPVKNHEFILEIAESLRSMSDDIVFLLVGDGPLRAELEEKVSDSGFSPMFRFAGIRPDVANLMRGAMDLFILPSHHEGLPLVGIEAQAAGLPCLFSDTITSEVCVVDKLVRFLPITEPHLWANHIQRNRQSSHGADPLLSRMQVEESHFNIHYGIEQLERYYASA